MKTYLFIRFDETGYEFEESDNLDDFVEFNHYLDYDENWEKEKKRIKEEMFDNWIFDGNDTYYAVLTHPCWEKFWVAEIINLDSEGNEVSHLDIDHCSYYLDEVVNAVYNQEWFWAYIYEVKDPDSDSPEIKYAYTIDDDGNIYNDTERWKAIAKEFDERELNSEADIEAFIEEFTFSLK